MVWLWILLADRVYDAHLQEWRTLMEHWVLYHESKRNTGFSLSAGKVGGERASGAAGFFRGFKGASWTARKEQ